MTTKKIAFLTAAEGIEQDELVQPWDAVEEAGQEPVLISPDSGSVQMFRLGTTPWCTGDDSTGGSTRPLATSAGTSNPAPTTKRSTTPHPATSGATIPRPAADIDPAPHADPHSAGPAIESA